MSRYASSCPVSTFQARLNIAHRRRRGERERYMACLDRALSQERDEERPLVRETFDAIARSDAFTLEASIQAFLDVRPLPNDREHPKP